MNRQNSNLFPQCLICNQTPVQGIGGGILLCKQFLCDACQDKMVSCSIDEPFYLQACERLKTLWHSSTGVVKSTGQRTGSR